MAYSDRNISKSGYKQITTVEKVHIGVEYIIATLPQYLIQAVQMLNATSEPCYCRCMYYLRSCCNYLRFKHLLFSSEAGINDCDVKFFLVQSFAQIDDKAFSTSAYQTILQDSNAGFRHNRGLAYWLNSLIC